MYGRILTIVLLIIVLLGIGVGAYFLFFNASDPGAEQRARAIRNLFPFGNPDTKQATGTAPRSLSDTGNGDAAGATGGFTAARRVEQISRDPVAGAVLIDTKEATVVRYMKRSNGNVFERVLGSAVERRVTNTTIPRVHRAVWNGEGDALILRTLDRQQMRTRTLRGSVVVPPATATSTSEGEIRGDFLTPGIVALAPSPSRDRVFLLRASSNERGQGVLTDFRGGEENTLSDFPLSEWLVDWPAERSIALTTKPAASVGGIFYLLDTQNGALTKVLEGIPGLTALVSPDTGMVLYSAATQNNGIALVFLDRADEISTQISLQTLPEKCVWSAVEEALVYCAVPIEIPRASYPDAWYQGRVSFSDQLWKMDLASGNTTLVSPLDVSSNGALGVLAHEEAGGIDAVDLQLDAEEDFLLLTNKKDGTLWRVRLTPMERGTSTETGS